MTYLYTVWKKALEQRRLLLGVLAGLALMLAVCFMEAGELHAESTTDIENGPKILVLNYHKIDEAFHPLSVSPALFDEQMRFLKEQGYHTISPQDLQAALEGEDRLPSNPVLITFDDGYADNYANAYPILKQYDMKATIFVVAGFVGKSERYLTWEQLREMEQNGITIESHTMNHIPLEELTDEQIRTELRDSKQLLEEHLGHPIQYIAYPTGTYNLHIAALAKEAGYEAAYTIKYGNVDMGSNLYALERTPVFHTENTMQSFYERLRYRPLFEEFGWKKR